MNKKRILIIASYHWSLLNFRGDLIKNLIENNYQVFTAAPNYLPIVKDELTAMGATPIEISLGRTGLNPLKDLKTISELKKVIRTNEIDLVFPYTIKPVLYGSIAANRCKVPVIQLITGLGFAFTGFTFKAKVLQRISEFLYRISIRKSKCIIFQNKDDHQLFLDRGIISKQQNVAFVSGSGVNLDKFKYRVNEKNTDNVSFLVVARLIEEKGIALYIEAAQYLKKKYPNSEFHIIGAPDVSPSAIKIDLLNELNEKGIIVYHGSQRNVPEHLHDRDIFVLPSFYREGIPRSILEALSVGLPIITTNTPGCKETIIKDNNGILIEPQNLQELISAMEFFLKQPEKIKEYGMNSRIYAEKRFDVRIINSDLLKLIEKALQN